MIRLLICVFLPSLILVSTSGWSTAAADCPSDVEWLPKTPAPSFDTPPPHPASDCGFYKPAWQAFLYVTQLDGSGRAAFLQPPFETMADVFGTLFTPQFAASKPDRLSLAPQGLHGSNDPATGPVTDKSTVIDAGARQAGFNGLLVDQNGNPVFYAIHMNDVFADFIRRNGLTTKEALQNASPDLEFPKGAIELKSAWQIVSDTDVPANYITTRALVPRLKREDDKLVVDVSAPLREVTVALLAVHVVFVLNKHPEFIWSTFEHIGSAGERDLAPAAGAHPGDNGLPGGIDGAISDRNFVLYKAGTLASVANALPDEGSLLAAFDPATQRFTKNGTLLQTSIFRRFPASKLQPSPEDEDITSLNAHMARAFKAHPPSDKRSHYQLVGAVWLDKPDISFGVDKPFANPPGMSTDDPAAIVAGEDGLSSMAMESFTQDTFTNCLSCHDTQAVLNPFGASVLMPAKKLNVSHILSRFVSEVNQVTAEAERSGRSAH